MHASNNDNVASRHYLALSVNDAHNGNTYDSIPQAFVLFGVAVFVVCLLAILADGARVVYANKKRNTLNVQSQEPADSRRS